MYSMEARNRARARFALIWRPKFLAILALTKAPLDLEAMRPKLTTGQMAAGSDSGNSPGAEWRSNSSAYPPDSPSSDTPKMSHSSYSMAARNRACVQSISRTS